jgi:hypothetical protein
MITVNIKENKMATTQKSKMMEKLLKNSTVKFSSVLSESVMFNDRDIIPTHIPIFNIAFSGSLDGGIAAGLTLLAGPSKSFKSLSSLVCVKAYLDKYKEAVCVLYDSEGGMTPDMLKSQGVDPSRVLHIPIDHLEMLKFDLVKQLQEINRGDKVIFVIDSIGNTASLKELNDALEEKSVAEMQRAKTIKSLFRMVTPSFVNKDIPCICICHTYQEMTMYPKQIISGGCLAEGTELVMFDDSLKQIQDIKVGDLVKTLAGSKPVSHIWNPDTLLEGEPECFEIEFEDGHKVVCSDSHPFLTTTGWVKARELTTGSILVSI